MTRACKTLGLKPRSLAVIVPAHNAASTIARTVRSALMQPEIGEVIVVDDGSKDGTAAAALQGDDGTGRLQVLFQANAGVSAAMNRGHQASTCAFITILDSDDFYVQGRFTAMAAAPCDWDFIADRLLIADEGADGGLGALEG